jgi:hypothetical protein
MPAISQRRVVFRTNSPHRDSASSVCFPTAKSHPAQIFEPQGEGDTKPHASEPHHCGPSKISPSEDVAPTADLVASSPVQSVSGIGLLTDAIIVKFQLPSDICPGLRNMASTIEPSKWLSTLEGRAYRLKPNEALALAVALSADLGMVFIVERRNVSETLLSFCLCYSLILILRARPLHAPCTRLSCFSCSAHFS